MKLLECGVLFLSGLLNNFSIISFCFLKKSSLRTMNLILCPCEVPDLNVMKMLKVVSFIGLVF